MDKYKKEILLINKMVKYCCDDLKLSRPKIKLVNGEEFTREHFSFGCYEHDSNIIHVVIKGRNLADCLRTLSHEIRHCWQNEQGLIKDGSGADGTDIENDANAYAGKTMRKFGRENPEIYFMTFN